MHQAQHLREHKSDFCVLVILSEELNWRQRTGVWKRKESKAEKGKTKMLKLGGIERGTELTLHEHSRLRGPRGRILYGTAAREREKKEKVQIETMQVQPKKKSIRDCETAA